MGFHSHVLQLGAWAGLAVAVVGCGDGSRSAYAPSSTNAPTTSAGSGTVASSTSATPWVNQPPSVSVVATGPTRVAANSWVLLEGAVVDDGLSGPVTATWTQVRGPGTTTFGSPTERATTATFDARGEYVLRVDIDDGEYVASAEVTVQSVEIGAIPAFPAEAAFLSRFDNDEETAVAYYAAIDPNRERTTLQGWLTVNGFDNGGPDTRASYYNAGDLRFGRQMILKKSANGVAFATINHANVGDAIADRDRIATVAMEYSPGPNGGPAYTKFYVFDANDRRVAGADLDGGGFRYVPNLCVTCHGGTPAPLANGVYPNGGNIGSTFLPFDADAFEFSTEAGFTRADLEDELRDMNAGVLETSPPAATKELIEGWYGGPGLPNAVQNSSFVPAGWVGSGHEDLYRDVVAASCRTCHTATKAPLDFRTADSFKNAFADTLTELVAGRMPHARVTFENFWRSEQPGKLITSMATPASPLPLIFSAEAVALERRIDSDPGDILGVRGDAFEMGGLLGEDPVRLLAEARATETSSRALRDRLRQDNVSREILTELDRRRDRLRRERRQLQDLMNSGADFTSAKAEFADAVKRRAGRSVRALAQAGPGRALAAEISEQIQRVRELVGGGRNSRMPRAVRQLRDVRDALKELRLPLLEDRP